MLIFSIFILLFSTVASYSYPPYSKLFLTVKEDPISSAAQKSIGTLEKFNTDYLDRMKVGREMNMTARQVEFQRAQILKADGLAKEKLALQEATKSLASYSLCTVLGIKAETGEKATNILRAWVSELGMKRGVLRAYDDNNNEISVDAFTNLPVYVKYNSTDNGDASMKSYNGQYFGVIFQPVIHEHDFLQFGDLPSFTWKL